MKSLLVAGLSLLYASAYSQSNGIAGYIILNNGDSLSGLVSDWKDHWPVKEIPFTYYNRTVGPLGKFNLRLEFISATAKTYQISEVDFLHIKPRNAHYFSREVEVDKKPRKRALLQLLSKGALNLYRYIGEKKKIHFFVQKGDGEIEELFKTGYKEKLRKLTSDCGSVGTADKYTERALMRFVQRYNSCFDEKSEYVSEFPKRKIVVGVFGGTALTAGRLSGNVNGSFTPNDGARGVYSRVGAPTAGVTIEFRPARVSNPSRGGVRLSFQNFPTTSRLKKYFALDELYAISLSAVAVGGTYKYFFTTAQKTNFYLNGELDVVSVLNGTAWRTTIASGQLTRSMGDFKKTGYSWSLGGGMEISDRVTIELRFKSLYASMVPGALVTFNGLEATIGYLLTK